VLLHSRGISSLLRSGHPNSIGPRKRPTHTIIPAMLIKDSKPHISFGLMGGRYQATGRAAFVSGVLDRGFDPQQANEVPRHFAYGGVLQLEQACRSDRGLLMGASDTRKDGCAFDF
jgi:gamma-glutamyltranspeptidase / glutathione hydrolase